MVADAASSVSPVVNWLAFFPFYKMGTKIQIFSFAGIKLILLAFLCFFAHITSG